MKLSTFKINITKLLSWRSLQHIFKDIEKPREQKWSPGYKEYTSMKFKKASKTLSNDCTTGTPIWSSQFTLQPQSHAKQDRKYWPVNHRPKSPSQCEKKNHYEFLENWLFTKEWEEKYHQIQKGNNLIWRWTQFQSVLSTILMVSFLQRQKTVPKSEI